MCEKYGTSYGNACLQHVGSSYWAMPRATDQTAVRGADACSIVEPNIGQIFGEVFQYMEGSCAANRTGSSSRTRGVTISDPKGNPAILLSDAQGSMGTLAQHGCIHASLWSCYEPQLYPHNQHTMCCSVEQVAYCCYDDANGRG